MAKYVQLLCAHLWVYSTDDNSSNNSKLISYVRKTELRTLVLVLLVHPPGEFSHCAPKSPKLFRKYDLENGHMDGEASHLCTIIDNLSEPHEGGKLV